MKLRKVINASGKMSILGVSTMTEKVIMAMNEGAGNFYIMEELHREAGAIIADHLHTESALVVNSASSGIALAVAGLITAQNQAAFLDIFNEAVFPAREVVLMKGHHVDYGAPVGLMIETGGGKVREAGYANGCTIDQLRASITNETICLLYIQSHHCVQKGMPSMKETAHLAREMGLPLIVDAAAEEEWEVYCRYADIVIISGSKALSGPTSGIIAGKRQYIEAIKVHQSGIGRAMKVGKESIIGLLEAIKQYDTEKISSNDQLEMLELFNVLKEHPGITVSIHQDAAGRKIYRARITVDEEKAGVSAMEITTRMKAGDPAIFTRDYQANLGSFEIDPRSLTKKAVNTMLETISQQLKKTARS